MPTENFEMDLDDRNDKNKVSKGNTGVRYKGLVLILVL